MTETSIIIRPLLIGRGTRALLELLLLIGLEML